MSLNVKSEHCGLLILFLLHPLNLSWLLFLLEFLLPFCFNLPVFEDGFLFSLLLLLSGLLEALRGFSFYGFACSFWFFYF